MTFQVLVLGLLAGYFIWRLYEAFNKKPTFPSDKIRLVSKETGEVLEMRILQEKPTDVKEEWNEKAFLTASKMVFQKVLHAFAKGDLKELKRALSPEVYAIFERDVLDRQEKKHKMDFSFICFDSVEIIKQTPEKDEITVRFVNEQINLLKDEQGQVIEGDPMTVACMTDTWVFKKISKDGWIISATESRMTPCAK